MTINFQTRICPKCHDDHSEDRACKEEPMSEKTPQASEWWFSADMSKRRFIVGKDSEGYVWYQAYKEGPAEWEGSKKKEFIDWHHEPACDSWDWQPETFPQWREADDKEMYAHYRLEKWGELVRVYKDGTEKTCHVNKQGMQYLYARPRLTREQAEALVVKPVTFKCLTCDAVVTGEGEACKDCYRYALERAGVPLPEPEKQSLGFDLGKPDTCPCDKCKPEFTSREMDLLGCLVNLRDQMVKICRQLDDCEKAIKTREVEVPL